MSSKTYRKLDIDLPRQPTVDQRPWLAAGIFVALLVLLMFAVSYWLSHRDRHMRNEHQHHTGTAINK
jgi:hypothetical protein